MALSYNKMRKLLIDKKMSQSELALQLTFLRKKKANEGELPQCYIKNNHKAMIAPPLFELVQQELKKRVEGKYRHSGVSIFSSKIRCGDCGAWYGSETMTLYLTGV